MKDLLALVPMGSVALLFWFVMRAVLGADRRERAALAAFDAARAAKPPAPAPAPEGDVVAGTVVGTVLDVRPQRTPGVEHDGIEAALSSLDGPGSARTPADDRVIQP